METVIKFFFFFQVKEFIVRKLPKTEKFLRSSFPVTISYDLDTRGPVFVLLFVREDRQAVAVGDSRVESRAFLKIIQR